MELRPAQRAVPPSSDAESVEALSLKDDLPHGPCTDSGGSLEIFAYVHPADFTIGLPDYQHYGIGLLPPIFRPADFLDLKDLDAVTISLLQVRVSRLELNIQTPPG